MRWWAITLGALAATLALAGCSSQPASGPEQVVTLLTFQYDPSRDVVLATTRDSVISPSQNFVTSTPVNTPAPPYTVPSVPYSTQHTQNDRQDYAVLSPPRIPRMNPAVPAQVYANALASLPIMSFNFPPDIRLMNPTATVNGSTLYVNYCLAEGLDEITCCEATTILGAFESWEWVPGILQVYITAHGEPLTALGPFTFKQPMPRSYHTYIVQSQSNEVGYCFGTLNPGCLNDALGILARREICEIPASKGFVPLIPPDVAFTADVEHISDGILPFNVTDGFPSGDSGRIGGLVLMLTQFPEDSAVQFSFCGRRVDTRYMRGSLDRPFTVGQLLLPTSVAMIPCLPVCSAINNATQISLGRAPYAFGNALVWEDWASQMVVPDKDAAPRLYILHKQEDNYTVFASGPSLSPLQLLQQGMPKEAIIALRLPHWEAVIVAEDLLRGDDSP